METPSFYTEKNPLRVSVSTIFLTVKTIIDSGKEAAFLEICAQKNAGVMVEAELINLVKSYLFDEGVHKGSQTWNLTAQRIVTSPGGRCPD